MSLYVHMCKEEIEHILVVFHARCSEKNSKKLRFKTKFVMSLTEVLKETEEKEYFPAGRCHFQFPKVNLEFNKESGLQSRGWVMGDIFHPELRPENTQLFMWCFHSGTDRIFIRLVKSGHHHVNDFYYFGWLLVAGLEQNSKNKLYSFSSNKHLSSLFCWRLHADHTCLSKLDIDVIGIV